MELVVDMTFKKSTKGTHVFEAAQEDAAVTTLYVQKADMPEAPASITVKITTVD